MARRFSKCHPLSPYTCLGTVGDVAYISLHARDRGFRNRCARALVHWRKRRCLSKLAPIDTKVGFFAHEPSVYQLQELPDQGVCVSDAHMENTNGGCDVWDLSVDALCQMTELAIRESVNTPWVAAKFADCRSLLPNTDIGVIANFAFVAHYARDSVVRKKAYGPYAQWRFCARLHFGTDCDACVGQFNPDMDHEHDGGTTIYNQQGHYGQCVTDPDDDDDDVRVVHGLNVHDALLGRSSSATYHDLSELVGATKKRKRKCSDSDM